MLTENGCSGLKGCHLLTCFPVNVHEKAADRSHLALLLMVGRAVQALPVPHTGPPGQSCRASSRTRGLLLAPGGAVRSDLGAPQQRRWPGGLGKRRVLFHGEVQPPLRAPRENPSNQSRGLSSGVPLPPVLGAELQQRPSLQTCRRHPALRSCETRSRHVALLSTCALASEGGPRPQRKLLFRVRAGEAFGLLLQQGDQSVEILVGHFPEGPPRCSSSHFSSHFHFLNSIFLFRQIQWNSDHCPV